VTVHQVSTYVVATSCITKLDWSGKSHIRISSHQLRPNLGIKLVVGVLVGVNMKIKIRWCNKACNINVPRLAVLRRFSISTLLLTVVLALIRPEYFDFSTDVVMESFDTSTYGMAVKGRSLVEGNARSSLPT